MPVINIDFEDLNRMLKEPLNSEEFSNIIPKIGADPDDICLLYTSDAADEEDSVDLGGRRIIK